jgi:hypothetical protein
LQLLFIDLLIIYRSKINIVLTARSSICSSSFIICIYGFYISQSSFSFFILEFSTCIPLTFFSQYMAYIIFVSKL